MKDNNLLILLKNLSAYEMNKLRKFIVSPYFNKSQKIIDLFDTLKSDVLKSTLKTKEYYYSKIYINEDYNDQKYRNLNSDLFQLTLKFLAQEEYEKDHRSQANNLIVSVQERELKPLFKKSISTALKMMDKVPYQDGYSYLQKFNLEKNIFNLTTEFEKKTTIRKNERGITVLKINDNLDYFYMIEKLKYYNYYLSLKRIINIDYEFPYIKRVLAIVKTHQKTLPPALQIYFEMYKTSLDSNNMESYENLKILINKFIHLFTPLDAKGVYESLINFSVKQINGGNPNFYQEMIDIYSAGIENGAILDKGYLSPSSFRNIVAIGLRLKNIEWTENFIKSKINLLEPQLQENAYKFNLARLYFYKNDFEKVIETVREVEFKDPIYANVSKTLIMLSYYELFDEEALIYFSESFSVYVRRSTGISERVKKDFLNLIKFTKRLSKARYDKSSLPKLKVEILRTEQLASKQWFLEKLKDVKLPNEE